MVPIITDRNAAVKKGMLADGRYFIRAQTGEAMYLPIRYDNRLDLSNMLVTSDLEEAALRTDLPDLNELIRKGYVLEAAIYREHDIVPQGFGDRFDAPPFSHELIRAILAEFREHGFNVTREALLHNFRAWSGDLKSGFRDDKNGYHLFTPCGCNPLSFRATSLESELDWQETYMC